MVARRRRLLAALFAGLSVLLALTALRPAPPVRFAGGPTAQVLVAAHDLAAGTVLEAGDVRTVSYPSGLRPDGVLRAGDRAVGRRVVLPLRAGEPLTDVRFLGDGLLARLVGTGTVAAPVRIADAGEVALVRVGDRVDVLSAAGSDGVSAQDSGTPRLREPATTLAAGAVVLSVPQAASTTITDGGLVVVAVPPETARTLAGAAASDRLSLVLRP